MRRTVGHLARERFRAYADRVQHHRPSGDEWEPKTWEQGREEVTNIGAGLWSLGCRKGDKVAILSGTRAEWMSFDIATLAFGGVVVGIYPTLTPEQVAYILRHSESRVLVVESPELLEPLRGELTALHGLEHVVLIDGSARNAISLADLQARGQELLDGDPHLPDRILDEVEPDDVATLVYTSGTTGPPKGVVLTHGNLVDIAERAVRHMGVGPDDLGVVFLPLAHSLQRVATYTGIYAGASSYFAASLERAPEAWLAAQPTSLSTVPRIFEKVHARIASGLAEQPERRRRIFALAMKVGHARARCLREGRPVALRVQLGWALFDRLIFSRVRARVFGARVRFLISGGAPIAVELLEFFHAMGLLILEGYGLTETSAPATLNQEHAYRFGTVGRALPDVELRIAEDGEILIRGPGNFREYYKDHEATAAAFTEDGFFKSGDIGSLDPDGYLRITDRKKDLIITAAGKNIAPQNIENAVKGDPHISQIMVHGDRRPYLVALVTLDAEEMELWAKKNGRAGATLAELAADPDVVALVEGAIGRTNATLARFETIKKLRVLADDFTVENGMLTPTLKVRRRAIMERYGDLIDSMYEDR